MMILAVKVIFSLPASGMVDKLASGRGNLTESVFIPAMSGLFCASAGSAQHSGGPWAVLGQGLWMSAVRELFAQRCPLGVRVGQEG